MVEVYRPITIMYADNPITVIVAMPYGGYGAIDINIA
jgi:hypothetical protein